METQAGRGLRDCGLRRAPVFFAAEWKPDPRAARVLYVGWGGYRKGIDVLLESLALTPNRSWAVRFAGDAELGREFAAANFPQTEFVGMLRWSDLLEELRHA